MATKPYDVGFVYVLTNRAMPGLVKIGMTKNLAEDRAKGLYTTGVPVAFDVEFRTTTSRPRDVERKAHEVLERHRYNNEREFFQVGVEAAIEAVRLALVDASGVDSWHSQKPHVLADGDRLSLALGAGQIFALIGYKDFNQVIAGEAEILDLWQAHSEGDLLEIYATGSSSDVAGFSDNDHGCTEDPVPFLDRNQTVANGIINGRERLAPGDRLLWLPSPEDSDDSTHVVFEAGSFCQVVSRTWSPLLAPHGFPLLLNDFLYEGAWPAASSAIKKVLSLPAPRTWAPRISDPPFTPVGTEVPNPYHWLPQLKPRQRRR
ncbi:UNVERIFIED_ORG: hypothetical protein J2Y77_004130 [Pseudomonas lini]